MAWLLKKQGNMFPSGLMLRRDLIERRRLEGEECDLCRRKKGATQQR
jgi:hypothetical protein